MLDKTNRGAMREQFMKAGIHPRVVRMNIELARYRNDGGTLDELMGLARSAFELPDGGRAGSAVNGLRSYAPVRQPNGDDVGQRSGADKAKHAVPVPSPTIASGVGHSDVAEKASVQLPPAREPTAAQVSAMSAVTKTIAQNAFDRELTRTGMPWGNVFYRDLDAMREDGEMAQAVRAHIGHLRGDDRHKRIRDLMTPREFLLLTKRVRENRHAA